jgi:group I intron endonuclease
MQFNIPAEHERASGVYVIRNTLNNKVYVGSTKDFWHRFSRHLSCLRTGKHHSNKLQNFVLKYGIDKLNFSLLELCEPIKEQYLACEQKWMNQLECSRKGFNISPTATSRLGVKGKPLTKRQKDAITKAHKGKEVSPETRRRLSEARKGYSHSEETRAKLREARTKYVCSPETKAKMSATRIGKKLNLSSEQRARMSERMLGKGHSDEARAKMSETRTGRKASEETKQKMREAYARANTPELQALRKANSLRARAKIGPKERPPVSEETRRKLSEAGKGRKISAELREKLLRASIGRIPSEETRRKMSEAKKGKPSPRKGKATSEARAEMSATLQTQAPTSSVGLQLAIF